MSNLNLLSTDFDKQKVSYRIYTSLKSINKKKAAKFLEKSPYKDSLLQQVSKDKEARAARKAKRLSGN